MNDPSQWRIRSADTGIKVLLARLGVHLASVLTLYLAFPWLLNLYLRAWAGRLVLGGQRVRYTGSGMGLVKLWLKVWLLTVLTLTLYWWLRGRGAVNRYVDSHLTWAEE